MILCSNYSPHNEKKSQASGKMYLTTVTGKQIVPQRFSQPTIDREKQYLFIFKIASLLLDLALKVRKYDKEKNKKNCQQKKKNGALFKT